MGVMMELMRRGVLQSVLAGREADNLVHILKFIHRHMWKPNFQPLLDVLDIIIGIHSKSVYQSLIADL
jgi:hypothetical protein